MREKEPDSENDSDDEEKLMSWSQEIEEEEKDFWGADILFLSVKLLIIYEILMQAGTIWTLIIPFHFGLF